MDLVEQYRMMHKSGHFNGHSIRLYADSIAALVRKHDAKTLLDYGSGKGAAYISWGWDKHVADKDRSGVHWCWGGIVPTCYDPAVERFSEKPKGKFDGVLCVDVLEHLPESEICDTLEEIFSYAKKFVFFSICCRPAKKVLPDGRNCHLTVKDQMWWLSTIEGLSPSVEWVVEWNE